MWFSKHCVLMAQRPSARRDATLAPDTPEDTSEAERYRAEGDH
jgi:hypothetical protein